MVLARTKGDRELHPPRDENTAEMAMGYNDQVPFPDTLFKELSMVLLYHIDDCVYSLRHLVRILATRTTSPPNLEVSILFLDLGGGETFIVAIVPFTDFLRELVRRGARLVSEKKLARGSAGEASKLRYIRARSEQADSLRMSF